MEHSDLEIAVGLIMIQFSQRGFYTVSRFKASIWIQGQGFKNACVLLRIVLTSRGCKVLLVQQTSEIALLADFCQQMEQSFTLFSAQGGRLNKLSQCIECIRSS